MASTASKASLALFLAATLISGALTPLAGPAWAASTQLDQADTGLEAAYVRGVQKELAAHGYDPGAIDGVSGPRTRAAVSAYQADAGLEVDGKADKRLLDHLKFALPKVYAFGAPKAGHALDLQRALAKRGYYLGPQDGVAGPDTYRALDRFQQDAGQPPDTEISSRAVLRVQEAPANVKADAAN